MVLKSLIMPLVLVLLALEVMRFLLGASFDWPGLALRWLLVAAVVLAAVRLPARLLLGIGVVAALALLLAGSTLGAWLVLGIWLALLARVELAYAAEQPILLHKRWRAGLGWARRLALALVAGIVPLLLAQVEAAFADEEFFVALEAMALSLLWLVLLWATHAVARRMGRPTRSDARLGLVATAAGTCVALVLAANAYPQSFFSPDPPSFAGISAEAPFLCGSGAPDLRRDDGAAVFQRLLALVERRDPKGTSEYALLSLGRNDHQQAVAFREALLAEARAGQFTEPAGSVKYGQTQAAIRVFYLLRVRERFPDLFSPSDEHELSAWFAAINRRAQTVEPVDWLYALAFSSWPEGPYENQESGAGLLAALEQGGLAAPELSAQNRDYLARNQRGWQLRFRNTDDALIYQAEWIRNAMLQAAYTGELNTDNRRRSFEWLLALALPDGARIRQNHPVPATMADIAYLGAELLDDPRYIWLSARGLEALEDEGLFLPAFIGATQPSSLVGRSPELGSCLLYGDSGLPTQTGPLAPDKLVFRDGWGENKTYLLLNLRFSGWHRYKATGSLSLAYHDAPLIVEDLVAQPFAWLPKGRSLFRDKRVPRESLNGLLVARNGLSAALEGLLGLGGPWAQDPPLYARVTRFETSDGVDSASIRLEGWRGWNQQRTVYLYHGGPAVIIDEAEGSAGSYAALAWHLQANGLVEGRRIRVGNDKHPAEVVLVPLKAGEPQFVPGTSPDDPTTVLVPAQGGQLHAAAVLLSGTWVGAPVTVTPAGLLIGSGIHQIVVPYAD